MDFDVTLSDVLVIEYIFCVSTSMSAMSVRFARRWKACLLGLAEDAERALGNLGLPCPSRCKRPTMR